ncbi:MAG: neocarzinostatin apoprotein domain-containing protein [Nocardioidaceae bacterium]
MRLIRTAVALLVILAGSTATMTAADAAAPAPTIAVSRTTGLTKGTAVTVWATGITAKAAVRVIECDQFNDNPDIDCPGGRSPSGSVAEWDTTASASGTVKQRVTLRDPVFRSQEFGDASPVYCRADVCRIFVVWADAQGATQVLSSKALTFRGSPATIAARPSTDLGTTGWVSVTGTAHGAEGHSVTVLEQACFDLVQARGCYDPMPVRWAKVRSDGTFRVSYPAQRFIGESGGTDCADPEILGRCVLSAVVLDSQGRPDDSFGVPAYGEPSAGLGFAAPPA